jgi:hypothetical protein
MTEAFYRTQAWRRLRAECLARHPTCATAGCGKPSRVADHVTPRSQGGSDSLMNLVGRCITCHNRRRGTAEPKLPGCNADGTPRDPSHWWGNSAQNLSGLRGQDRSGVEKVVSFPIVPGGRRNG